MASSLPLLSSLFILFLASTVLAINITQATSTTTVVAKDLVPCTMCAECENPCQPLPPPPPPAIECPPPPSPSPPPASPPPPPAVIECPPPPKLSCQDNCEIPEGSPRPPYPPVLYFPPGTPYPYYVPDNVNDSGGKMKPLQALLFSILCAFLCIPYYYLFI